ncbi:MAG: PEGA domain-containing protein [Patescibacteria group bacterium]
MTHKTRRWLYRFFILLFIILTSYTSLYATGYQLNLRGPWRLKRLIVKTGTLAINSQPSGASIYINDKKQSDFSWKNFNGKTLATPAKIKSLAPGEYEIRLEKDGYWPWEKRLNINAEQTTYAEDINLFKKDSILNILECGCQEIDLNPNQRYLLLKQGKKIIDLRNNRDFKLDIKEEITSYQWLKDSDRVLINNRLFDLSTNSWTDYQEIIGPEIKNLFYDETSNRLYYQYKDSLNYFENNKKISQNLIDKKDYSSFYLKDDRLFLLRKKGQTQVLESYNLKSHALKELSLPAGGNYSFHLGDSAWLEIFEEKSRSLFLVDPEFFMLPREGLKNFRGGLWLQADKLLYHTDFEIYLFDLKQNTKTLMDRVGYPIKDLVWQAKNNYLIYATSESINSLDLSNHNSTRLLAAENISSIFLDSKNNTLYFTATINQKSGLYKMIVQ